MRNLCDVLFLVKPVLEVISLDIKSQTQKMLFINPSHMLVKPTTNIEVREIFRKIVMTINLSRKDQMTWSLLLIYFSQHLCVNEIPDVFDSYFMLKSAKASFKSQKFLFFN